ncbi:MAG: hypothetical protein JWO80_5019 [Bryobacterales bacterium]|nr:hypothetical protein [Bryobacterales bacterium]
MRQAVENRSFISFLLASAIGMTLFFRLPFPSHDVLLQLIHAQRPGVFQGIKWTYTVMLFTTPYIAFSVLFSFAYIFAMKQERKKHLAKLPPYPAAASRDQLFVIVGEVHQQRKREAAETPQWLALPERGLYTGIAVFGAIGSGKTSCCMYPFAEQILGYSAADASRRAAGMVLEVKGDFCHKVRELLGRYGRGSDYLEVSLDSEYRYNPLHNDLEAYALAYGIASLLNNLFGKGKEPFWQQAYTNLVKFIILLHKTLYDYVTLFDVYECAINHALLAQRIHDGEERMSTHYVLVNTDTYLAHEDLDRFTWERDDAAHCMRAQQSNVLEAYLNEKQIPYDLLTNSGDQLPGNARKQAQFAAVKRWFTHDWMKIEPKLRTSIVEGISVFLSLFDDNPAVKHTFCPPKETYDPEKNKDGKYGKPLPKFADLIESGKVVALNFPVAANPGLARTVGTLMKQDFQRAMIGRIPEMEKHKERHFRPAMFLCDEYHGFATVGESDPTGDEKFFALSRQAKCIPIVATQSISSIRSTLSGESWRTLLQTFRTKIFLAMSDDFSAETASKLCGKEEQFKLNYSISENGHDAKVSLFSGRTTAHRSSVSASKSYNLQRDYVFEPKVFGELKNAESIVLAYDGVNPLPPTLCYLKPYYLDRDLNYFEQLRKGLI